MRIASQFETDRVEYKEAQRELPQSIWKTISAFANARGGVIILGVRQEGQRTIIQGVENPQQMIDTLVSTISAKFNFCPVIKPAIKTEKGKHLVRIEVEEALPYEKPIYIKDAGPMKGGYKRVGSVDQRLADKDIQGFFQERLSSPDAHILPAAASACIDKMALSMYRKLRRLQKDDARELLYNDKELLHAYSVISKDGKHINLAGLLLFGKTNMIKKYLPHFRVDVIRIKGTEWGKDKDPFLSQDMTGNLLSLRVGVLDALEKQFMQPFVMGEGLARTDTGPLKTAFREAVGNLLMHQNYLHRSPSQVRIYNDRVEFYNPGCSLKDPADFNNPGSELRNSLIAPVFYDIGWAETKGTGFRTAILALKKRGYPAACWINDEKNDTFTIVFPYPADRLTVQVPYKYRTSTVQVPHKSDIVRFCVEPHSLQEIMGHLGLKHRAHMLEEYIKPLVADGMIALTIPDKPKSPRQKYLTTEKGKLSINA